MWLRWYQQFDSDVAAAPLKGQTWAQCYMWWWPLFQFIPNIFVYIIFVINQTEVFFAWFLRQSKYCQTLKGVASDSSSYAWVPPFPSSLMVRLAGYVSQQLIATYYIICCALIMLKYLRSSNFESLYCWFLCLDIGVQSMVQQPWDSEAVCVRTVLFLGKCGVRFLRFKKGSRALATRAKTHWLDQNRQSRDYIAHSSNHWAKATNLT